MPPFAGCDAGAYAFVEKHFHDCVYNLQQLLGFVLGMTAILLWLVAQVPQFVDNIARGSAEGLSIWFLAEWFLGDTLNLLGCLIQGQQLPTTTFLAMYFVLVDMCMLMQFIYLGALQKRRQRIAAAVLARHASKRLHGAHSSRYPSRDGSTRVGAGSHAHSIRAASAQLPLGGSGAGGNVGRSTSSKLRPANSTLAHLPSISSAIGGDGSGGGLRVPLNARAKSMQRGGGGALLQDGVIASVPSFVVAKAGGRSGAGNRRSQNGGGNDGGGGGRSAPTNQWRDAAERDGEAPSTGQQSGAGCHAVGKADGTDANAAGLTRGAAAAGGSSRAASATVLLPGTAVDDAPHRVLGEARFAGHGIIGSERETFSCPQVVVSTSLSADAPAVVTGSRQEGNATQQGSVATRSPLSSAAASIAAAATTMSVIAYVCTARARGHSGSRGSSHSLLADPANVQAGSMGGQHGALAQSFQAVGLGAWGSIPRSLLGRGGLGDAHGLLQSRHTSELTGSMAPNVINVGGRLGSRFSTPSLEPQGNSSSSVMGGRNSALQESIDTHSSNSGGVVDSFSSLLSAALWQLSGWRGLPAAAAGGWRKVGNALTPSLLTLVVTLISLSQSSIQMLPSNGPSSLAEPSGGFLPFSHQGQGQILLHTLDSTLGHRHHSPPYFPPSGTFPPPSSPSGGGGDHPHGQDLALVAGTVLGYMSSLLYLIARMAQIRKNLDRGSTEGMSALMFVFTIGANACTGCSILLRLESWTQAKNQLPWLCGTFGTVTLDLVLLYQGLTMKGGGGELGPAGSAVLTPRGGSPVIHHGRKGLEGSKSVGIATVAAGGSGLGTGRGRGGDEHAAPLLLHEA